MPIIFKNFILSEMLFKALSLKENKCIGMNIRIIINPTELLKSLFMNFKTNPVFMFLLRNFSFSRLCNW